MIKRVLMAFLIGRGIWGKPWKLAEMERHMNNEQFVIDNKQMFYWAARHLDAMIEFYGPKGLFAFRKHLPFYLKGLTDASALRQKLVVSNSLEDVRQTFVQLMEQHGS